MSRFVIPLPATGRLANSLSRIVRTALTPLALSCGFGVLGSCEARDSSPEQSTEEIVLPDLDGAPHRVLPGDRPTVVVFVGHDCPIANAYAPEIGALFAEWSRAERLRAFVVHVDGSVPLEELRAHAASYRLPAPILRDARHRLVRRTGARTTPTAVVFDGGGDLVYRGRIDDRYPELGVRRPAQHHELRDAVAAVLAGEPVAVARTVAVGCAIERRVGR